MFQNGRENLILHLSIYLSLSPFYLLLRLFLPFFSLSPHLYLSLSLFVFSLSLDFPFSPVYLLSHLSFALFLSPPLYLSPSLSRILTLQVFLFLPHFICVALYLPIHPFTHPSTRHSSIPLLSLSLSLCDYLSYPIYISRSPLSPSLYLSMSSSRLILPLFSLCIILISLSIFFPPPLFISFPPFISPSLPSPFYLSLPLFNYLFLFSFVLRFSHCFSLFLILISLSLSLRHLSPSLVSPLPSLSALSVA